MRRRFGEWKRARIAVASAALVAAIAPATPVAAADPVEVVFGPTGAEQSWVVPDNTSSIHVVLIGGNGGDVTSTGFAHVVTGDLAVTAGATLYIEVGGKGANSIGLPGAAGGFNGGGAGGTGALNAGAGGGGASDIRTVARTEAGSLDSRLIVAAGGGGAGGANGSVFGSGGNAASDGTIGSEGPGPSGGGGGRGFPGVGGVGGGGSSGAQSGESGSFGIGGTGGTSTVQNGNGGGGGGGGYYGGGGGGGGAGAGGGGGGGGSSFVGGAQNSSVTLNNSADPSISITYTPGDGPPDPAPDTGIVDAEVTVPTSAACIELSSTSVTFGTQRFGSEDVAATPGITVTNCSGSDEMLLARGTDATGTGATWNLVDAAGSCAAGTLAIDDYHLKLRRDDTQDVTRLAGDNKTIRPLAAGEDGSLDALIDMPCPGSSGAGQTMAMQIVFLVTE